MYRSIFKNTLLASVSGLLVLTAGCCIVCHINAGFPGFLISLTAALAASVLIGAAAARHTAKSIERSTAELSDTLLKIGHGMPVFHQYAYDELNLLSNAGEQLSASVSAMIGELEFETGKLEYILESMSSGLIILGSHNQVVSINRSAKEILGISNCSADKNIADYSGNKELLQNLDTVRREGGAAAVDMDTGDGKVYCAHISRLKQAEAGAYGVIILFVDVTAERKAQKMRQDFFSNASHELKTPITSINGYAELLNGPIPVDDAHRKIFVERIKADAKNMTGLINDILEISRLEMKSAEVNIEQISLQSEIQNCIELFKPMADERGIRLESQCENIFLMIDKKHIEQILNNLISNAVKYNKENGDVKICGTREKGKVKLTVTDTGIGIPAESIPRIFERFYRVDHGRSRKMGGTGLGLSIVHHVVQFYGGSVSAFSRWGEGTEITVLLGDRTV